MCLVTVYVDYQDQQKEVMKDVARMEATDDGFLLIGLLGDRKYVAGSIVSLDFVDKHSVVLCQ
jgi:predicted RNA-binding protein